MNLKRLKVLWSALLLVSLLNIIHTSEAAETENLLQNPSFEEWGAHWGGIDWSVVSAKAEDAHSGTNSLKYWDDEPFQFTVTQTVYGLPSGKYSLSVYTQGGGGENVLRLFAVPEGGEKLTAHIVNTDYLEWKHVSISNIAVTEGTLTVGVEASGNPGNWGSMDDFALIRTGDLDEAPLVVESVEPVSVQSIVRAMPQLPEFVTVTYTNGSTGQHAVVWNTATPEQYQQTGTFMVTGTLEGTDLEVNALVTVTYKPLDLNDDSVIDAGDLAQAAYYHGKHSNDPLWHLAQAADVDNDGTVTVHDMRIIAEHM